MPLHMICVMKLNWSDLMEDTIEAMVVVLQLTPCDCSSTKLLVNSHMRFSLGAAHHSYSANSYD
jgi:hypothetical protein